MPYVAGSATTVPDTSIILGTPLAVCPDTAVFSSARTGTNCIIGNWTTAPTSSTQILRYYFDGQSITGTTSVYTSDQSASITGYWRAVDGTFVELNTSFIQTGPVKAKRGPLIKKSIKSSIKRALQLIANFGMEEDVRIFLGGGEIEVSHPESLFKFVLTKSRGIVGATERPGISTPYKLALFTKTNIHLANLCVYMTDTPVLDQILALSMFIKSGNEESILEKANYSCLNSDISLRQSLAVGNPMLEDKLRVCSTILLQRGNNGIYADGAGLINHTNGSALAPM